MRCLFFLLLVTTIGLLAPVPAAAQRDEDPSPEETLQLSMGGAAMSAGLLAFAVMLETRTDDAFGPVPWVHTSLTLASLGALGAHVSAFALLSGDVRHDRFLRAVFAGVSLMSSGLSLLSFALPTAWALTADPPTGEDAAAIVVPYLLGAMSVAVMVVGALVISGADDPPVTLSASVSPTSAMVVLGGRF